MGDHRLKMPLGATGATWLFVHNTFFRDIEVTTLSSLHHQRAPDGRMHFTPAAFIGSEREEDLQQALKIVETWRIRQKAKLNFFIVLTAEIVKYLAVYQQSVLDETSQRHLLAGIIIRGVNNICDEYHWLQRRKLTSSYLSGKDYPKPSTSVQNLARLANLPLFLVDTRHDATHNRLPELAELTHCVTTLYRYCYENYWRKMTDEYLKAVQRTRKVGRPKVKRMKRALSLEKPNEDSFLTQVKEFLTTVNQLSCETVAEDQRVHQIQIKMYKLLGIKAPSSLKDWLPRGYTPLTPALMVSAIIPLLISQLSFDADQVDLEVSKWETVFVIFTDCFPLFSHWFFEQLLATLVRADDCTEDMPNLETLLFWTKYIISDRWFTLQKATKADTLLVFNRRTFASYDFWIKRCLRKPEAVAQKLLFLLIPKFYENEKEKLAEVSELAALYHAAVKRSVPASERNTTSLPFTEMNVSEITSNLPVTWLEPKSITVGSSATVEKTTSISQAVQKKPIWQPLRDSKPSIIGQILFSSEQPSLIPVEEQILQLVKAPRQREMKKLVGTDT